MKAREWTLGRREVASAQDKLKLWFRTTLSMKKMLRKETRTQKRRPESQSHTTCGSELRSAGTIRRAAE